MRADDGEARAQNAVPLARRHTDDVQAQHLTVERPVSDALDDLHPVGQAGLGIVHLPVVAIDHTRGHGGAGGHRNRGLKVLAVDRVADPRVVIQPVRLLRLRHLDVPCRPVTRPNGAADLIVGMRGIRRFSLSDRRRFKQPAHAQPDVIDNTGLATDRDRLFDELLVQARVGLRGEFARARIVEEQLVELLGDARGITRRRVLGAGDRQTGQQAHGDGREAKTVRHGERLCDSTG